MKKIFTLTAIAFLCFNASAATLEASTTQPTYTGTSIPLLKITSGSGKTSYVSGVINDPTDPAATKGIYFQAPSGSSLSFTSSNTNVVKTSDITATEIESGRYAVKIKPTGVGSTKIAVKLSGASDYTIQYAASKASAEPSRTTWLAGSSDASAVAEVGDGYFFVADDENNLIRLYNMNESGMPVKEIDVTSMAGGSAADEFDIEGASVSDDGQTIYWIASLSNSKKGKQKEYRNRVFSTKLSGSGINASLSAGAYSTKMRDALIAFGDACNWDFSASASYDNSMIPKRIDGFNIEGLTLQKGGGAAYVAFRAPCVPLKGVAPTASNRKYAVMAPVTNFETMLAGSGLSSINPSFGEPVLFDFGGLGIRALERVGDYYVIIAGLFEGGGHPKAYLWDGTTNTDGSPITTEGEHLSVIDIDMSDLVQTEGTEVEGHPEAISVQQDGNNIIIHIVCDNGAVDLYGDGKTAKEYGADSKKFPWAKFRKDTYVYELTASTPVDEHELTASLSCSLIGNVLTVSGLHEGMPVIVASYDGKVIDTATAEGETYTVRLPSTNTTYIVKVGNKSIKLYY